MFYQKHLFICGNERPDQHPRGCCKAKGADAIRNYIKTRVKELNLPDTRVNQAGCLDRCELGPVMVVYPEGIWYKIETIAQAEEMIQSHLLHGNVCTKYMLRDDQ